MAKAIEMEISAVLWVRMPREGLLVFTGMNEPWNGPYEVGSRKLQVSSRPQPILWQFSVSELSKYFNTSPNNGIYKPI